MSFVELLASMQHVRAVERAQQALVRSRREAAPPVARELRDRLVLVLLQYAMPAVVVLATLRDTASARTGLPAPWAYVAIGALLLGSGAFAQMRLLSFSPREVLYLPDRAAVLLVRLWRQLPHLLGIGVAWAVACWIHLLGSPTPPLWLVAWCCVAALLAPVALAIARLVRRVAAPGSRSGILHCVLFALWPVAMLLDRPNWAGEDIVYFGMLVPIALLGVGAAGRLLHALWVRPRTELRALWPDWLSAPRLLVVFVLLMPNAWLQTEGHLLLMVSFATLALLSGVMLGLPRVLADVGTLEVASDRPGAADEQDHDVAGAVATPAVKAAVLPSPASPHRGRSLWRAGFALGRREVLNHGATVLFVGGLLFRLLVPLPLDAEVHSRLGSLVLGIGLAMPVLGMGRRSSMRGERLWHWGVDHREMARFDVVSTCLLAALPVLLVMLVTVTWLGWTESSTLKVLGVVAVFSVRIGWRGLAPRGEFALVGSSLILFALVVLVTSVCLPVLQWSVVSVALLVGLLGLARRWARWREADLTNAWVEARERHAHFGATS